ncbi:MAG: hypothetical protein R6X31_09650 [Anaerolineae bacterium]
MRSPILTAQAVVDVPLDQAREWFLSLKEHPDRYQFDTHAGFEFVEGSFGEVGARFETQEKFLFFPLRFLFELTKVEESEFWFRLIRPLPMGIWGRFGIEEVGKGRTRLSLDIGSETGVGQLLLRWYPVGSLIRQQIHREVGHIRSSMERMSGV